jgi:hypothetical protein
MDKSKDKQAKDEMDIFCTHFMFSGNFRAAVNIYLRVVKSSCPFLLLLFHFSAPYHMLRLVCLSPRGVTRHAAGENHGHDRQNGSSLVAWTRDSARKNIPVPETPRAISP